MSRMMTDQTWQRIFYGGSSFLMILGLVEAERSGLLAPSRWMAALGRASYAIYFIHVPAWLIAAKLMKRLQLWPLLPVSLWYVLLATTVMAVGVALSNAVEQPLLRLSRKVRSAGRLAPAPAA